MALTKSRGNMYPFVTHTWNAIKGIWFHDCPYCYMKKFDGLLPIRFDPKELEVNLGPLPSVSFFMATTARQASFMVLK